MFENKEFIKIASSFVDAPEYIQGAGGNVSIKLGGNKMIIKSSGMRFADINENAGIVGVDYIKIKDYYSKLSRKNHEDEPGIIGSSVISEEHENAGVPSMETGFHALLKKYVLHTHSVYTNVVACSETGEALFSDIFEGSGMDIVWVPYANPGLDLALRIRDIIKNTKRIPEVFFLENHGLIVTCEIGDRLLELHESVNLLVREKSGHFDAYPKTRKGQVSEKDANEFKNLIIFPDQAVFGYLINRIQEASKNEKETFEEIFVAWGYILKHISKFGLRPKRLLESDVEKILNMDTEKYRKSLMSGK